MHEGSKTTVPETVGDVLKVVHERLEQSPLHYGHGTDNAWDEAVQLVLGVLGLPHDAGSEVLSDRLQPIARDQVISLLERRIDERIPLPYLLGKAWFAGLEFICDERALVPRSPLAELILDDFAPWYPGPTPRRLLDLCCGGGSIGLAAAHYHPDLEVDGLDVDPDALALARENIEFLGLAERVHCYQSDLFSAVAGKRYDIILSNPPYVDAEDLEAMPQEFQREPLIGLGSGVDGLDLTRRILAEARAHLEPHGLLVVEVGNSWVALEQAYPDVPFTWLELAHGGHGVFVITAAELESYAASLRP